MTDGEVAQIVGNLAPKRIAHPSDPNNPLSPKSSLVPYGGEDPQPGDQLEFQTSHGVYTFNVQADGSWSLAGEPKAPKTAAEIAADSAAVAQGRLSVTDMSQAQAAQAKINAGRMPTSTELAALERVTALGATGTLSWLGQQLQRGNGTQGFGEGSQWNDHEQGQDVSVPYGTAVPLVRGTVTEVQDWGYGDYAVVIRQPNGTEVTVGHIQKPRVVVGQQVSEADTVQSGGQPSAISSGPQVEIRVKQNGAYVDPASVASTVGSGIGGLGITLPSVNKQHVTVAGKEYVFDPTSGSFTDTGVGTSTVKPDTVERNGTTYQFDPTTDTWRPATGLPGDVSQMGKVQQALQQHATTVDYIKSQLASGAITLEDANNYQTANDAYLQAALKGATPLELQKQQEANALAQATIGKDLINTRLTEGANLAHNLMTEFAQHQALGPDTGYNPLTYARMLTDYNSGGPGLADYAQGLVRGLGQPGVAAPGTSPRPPGTFAVDATTAPLPMPPGGDSDSARLAAQAGVAA